MLCFVEQGVTTNMLNNSITIYVPGHPRPQGSKKAFRRGQKIVMVESCTALHDWRSSVAYHAAQVRPEKLIDDAVWMKIDFSLPRPRNHYRTGAHSHLLRAVAPPRPISHQSGDLDKLIRTICDALTGIIYTDDSLIAHINCSKSYGVNPGVTIAVGRMK